MDFELSMILMGETITVSILTIEVRQTDEGMVDKKYIPRYIDNTNNNFNIDK